MNVSIIYVNYKTGELMLNSIRSVKELTEGINYEIIVVDNHSDDNLLSVIKEKYPEIICIESPENIGFGRANNLGIEIAQGECILFLNPDTLLINNAIAILYRVLESSEQIGACGGNLHDENKQATFSFYRKAPSLTQTALSIFRLSEIYLNAPRSRFFNNTGKPLEVASIIGADLMVKKNVLDKTGLFDPDFFLYAEEIELCYRIKQFGYKILSVPDAKIIHLEGKSPGTSKSRQFLQFQSYFRLFKKLYGEKSVKYIYWFTQLKNYRMLTQCTLLRNREKINYWKMKKETAKEAFDSIVNFDYFCKLKYKQTKNT